MGVRIAPDATWVIVRALWGVWAGLVRTRTPKRPLAGDLDALDGLVGVLRRQDFPSSAGQLWTGLKAEMGLMGGLQWRGIRITHSPRWRRSTKGQY